MELNSSFLYGIYINSESKNQKNIGLFSLIDIKFWSTYCSVSTKRSNVIDILIPLANQHNYQYKHFLQSIEYRIKFVLLYFHPLFSHWHSAKLKDAILKQQVGSLLVYNIEEKIRNSIRFKEILRHNYPSMLM